MINFYIDHPYEFFQDILQVEPTQQQKELLQSIPKSIKEKKNISVKAGHGVGKTFTEAGLIIWYLAVHYKGKVICTAPTQHQLYQVLWSELAKMNEKSLIRDLFEWTASKFALKDSHADWFAVARSSSKPENMQGFHAEHMLILVDEASGVDEEILEAIEGATTDEGNIIMMFGNPTRLKGAFYDSFNTKNRFFTNITMSCLDSTNVSDKYPLQIEAKYGKDSDIYRVRVLGDFPQQEDDSIISLYQVEKAIERSLEEEEPIEVEFGCDVARFGNDETTIYKRINNIITEEWISKENTTMEIVGHIVQLANDYEDSKIIINIDDTGVGGGVTDRLRELRTEGKLPKQTLIHGVNNNKKAFDSKYYKNIITELWYKLKDVIKDLDLPNDKTLVTQLSSRHYEMLSDGRLMVESKDKVKKKGSNSPDRADGVLLTLYSLIGKRVRISNENSNDIQDIDSIHEQVSKFRKSDLKTKMKFYKKRK